MKVTPFEIYNHDIVFMNKVTIWLYSSHMLFIKIIEKYVEWKSYFVCLMFRIPSNVFRFKARAERISLSNFKNPDVPGVRGVEYLKYLIIFSKDSLISNNFWHCLKKWFIFDISCKL